MDGHQILHNYFFKKVDVPRKHIEWIHDLKAEPISVYTRRTRFRRMLMSVNGLSKVNEDEYLNCQKCKTPAEVISKLGNKHLKCASVWKCLNKKPVHRPLSILEIDRCFKLFNYTKCKTYRSTLKKVLIEIGRSDLIIFLR